MYKRQQLEDRTNVYANKLVQWIHTNVQIIDCTHLTSHPSKFIEILHAYNNYDNITAQPKLHVSSDIINSLITPPPTNMTRISGFPSEHYGMRVHDYNINNLWRKAMHHIVRFGKHKINNSQGFTELICLVSVLTHNDDYGVVTNDIEDYLNEWKKPASELNTDNVTYTYPHRLKKYFNYNQIDACVYKLKKKAHTRSAVMSLWDATTDMDSDAAPCMSELQFFIEDSDDQQQQNLTIKVNFRSHDIGQGYVYNLHAIKYMQQEITTRNPEWKSGNIIIVSSSAHIYDYYINNAIDEINNLKLCEYDKRGNVSVSVDGNNIIAILHDCNGMEIDRYTGNTPEQILSMMLTNTTLSDPGNWVWTTIELMRHYYNLPAP